MKRLTVHCTNDRIWNHSELLRFLVTNQGQSIGLKINPEAIDLAALGLYEILDQFAFEHVEIETNNPLEQHDRYCIRRLSFADQLSKFYQVQPAQQTWNQSRVFMALYGRPTAARLGMAAHLYQHHRSLSHIHIAHGATDDELHLFELDKLLAMDKNSIEPAGQLIKHMPVHIAPNTNYASTGYFYDQESRLTDCYQDILVDVVGETFVQGCTFLPTEKTTRPMLLKKPFVIFASRDYLDYLHQIGFRTFCDFWDETYDGYQGRDRYLRILKLIDYLASLNTAQLADMYASMQSVLDHNWELLHSQTYLRKVTQIT